MPPRLCGVVDYHMCLRSTRSPVRSRAESHFALFYFFGVWMDIRSCFLNFPLSDHPYKSPLGVAYVTIEESLEKDAIIKTTVSYQDDASTRSHSLFLSLSLSLSR